MFKYPRLSTHKTAIIIHRGKLRTDRIQSKCGLSVANTSGLFEFAAHP